MAKKSNINKKSRIRTQSYNLRSRNVRFIVSIAVIAIVGGVWAVLRSYAATGVYLGNQLKLGQCMNSGDYLKSSTSTAATFAFQTDGNLVVYNALNKATWSSGTFGVGATKACLQTDGNFVIYNSKGAVWHTYTYGLPINYIWIDTTSTGEPNVVMKDASGGKFVSNFFFFGRRDRLGYGYDALVLGTKLISKNGLYKLNMQTDGNLVIYNAVNRPIWSTATYGKNARFATFYVNEGKFRVYAGTNNTNGNANVLWESNNPRFYGTTYANQLVMQDDGNLVLYSTTGKAIWNTGTQGR